VAVWLWLQFFVLVRSSDFALYPRKQIHIPRKSRRRSLYLGNMHGFVLQRAVLGPGHVCDLVPCGRHLDDLRLHHDRWRGFRFSQLVALSLFDVAVDFRFVLVVLQLDCVLPC
jgi:hypothetical protein